MITGKELQKNLSLARAELKRSRRRRAQSFAFDVNARIKRRVINKGERADGKDFGVYSQSYQKYRKKKNLTAPPFPKVNFKKTSRMWTNTRGQASHDEYPEIYIGPTSPENIEKLAWMEDKFGDIIEMSESESAAQVQTEVKKIVKILKKHNLL